MKTIFEKGELNEIDLDQICAWLKTQSQVYQTKDIPFLISGDFYLSSSPEKEYSGLNHMIEGL